MLAGLSRSTKQAQRTSNRYLYWKSSDWAKRPNDLLTPGGSFFRFEAVCRKITRESCGITPCLSFTMQSRVFSHVPFSYCLVTQTALRGEQLLNIQIKRWAPKNLNLTQYYFIICGGIEWAYKLWMIVFLIFLGEINHHPLSSVTVTVSGATELSQSVFLSCWDK